MKLLQLFFLAFALLISINALPVPDDEDEDEDEWFEDLTEALPADEKETDSYFDFTEPDEVPDFEDVPGWSAVDLIDPDKLDEDDDEDEDAEEKQEEQLDWHKGPLWFEPGQEFKM